MTTRTKKRLKNLNKNENITFECHLPFITSSVNSTELRIFVFLDTHTHTFVFLDGRTHTHFAFSCPLFPCNSVMANVQQEHLLLIPWHVTKNSQNGPALKGQQ